MSNDIQPTQKHLSIDWIESNSQTESVQKGNFLGRTVVQINPNERDKPVNSVFQIFPKKTRPILTFDIGKSSLLSLSLKFANMAKSQKLLEIQVIEIPRKVLEIPTKFLEIHRKIIGFPRQF